MKELRCDLCGTNVKVVGHTTMHYEPVADRDMLLEIINSMHAGCCECADSSSEEELADTIISAMYGTVDNVETVGGE